MIFPDTTDDPICHDCGQTYQDGSEYRCRTCHERTVAYMVKQIPAAIEKLHPEIFLAYLSDGIETHLYGDSNLPTVKQLQAAMVSADACAVGAIFLAAMEAQMLENTLSDDRRQIEKERRERAWDGATC